jgi:hypothetical protein
MMSVHVAHQEVQHGHVHQVVEPPAAVVRGYFPNQGTIIVFGLPLGFPAFMVGPPPRMSPYLKRPNYKDHIVKKMRTDFI